MANRLSRPWPVLLALLAACVPSGPAAGEIRLTLRPADAKTGAVYRDVVLGVDNRSGRTIRAVSVRMAEGGPTFLLPVTVPPESNASLPTALPVHVPEQAYRLAALAEERADSPALAEDLVATSWPADQVSPVAWVDPDAYARFELQSAGWSYALRRNAFLGAVVVCVALAGTLLVRRPGHRLALVGAVLAGATAATAAALGGPVVDARYVFGEVSSGMGRDALVSTEIVVTSRRTAQWTHPSAELVPVYANLGQMAGDTAVVHPARGLSLRIAPGEVRVFRFPTPPSDGQSQTQPASGRIPRAAPTGPSDAGPPADGGLVAGRTVIAPRAPLGPC